MKKKLTSLILAMLLMVQTLVPGVAFATNNNNVEKTKQNLVKVGELDTKSYPKLDNKTILAIQKQAREKHKPQKRNRGAGLFSADNPYLPGQNPTDQEKAVAYGKVNVNFKTVGLNDNGTIKEFQWKEIFGVDSNGNPTNAKIHFIQRDAKTNKELGRYTLYVNKAGNYKWLDALGKEALLPLYSDKLEPYKYNAALDYQLTDKVKLLTIEISTTKETSTFKKDEKGRNVATISLKLELGQVASTKFVSEWKASLDENSRPNVEGLYATKNKDLDGNEIENLIAFPKKNNDPIQLRNNNYDPENSPKLPYDQGSPSEFRNVPEVKVVQGLKFKDDNDLDGTPTYNIDEDNKIITNLEDSPTKFKFKYELKYDVINGGKLTMTEVIPVTFDANGGKFKNFTAPDTEKQIVKEVDYEGTLADKAENPTKPGKAFKGWATDKDGKNPAKDVDFANLTAAKTFYAIWSDEDIQAEELKTSESLGRFPKKGDPKFTNDFVPTFDQLKAKVKVKNSNGELEPLPTTGVTFSIVDGTKEYTENSDALKKFIYEKVKENKVDEVSRKETVEAKVKYSDGTERKVEIPITVLKNIYKGSDQGNKLPYIPDDYVKVTINPTDKAQDSQKTYYYVNPKAKVEIPRTKNPVGTGDNKFSKWTIKADSDTVVADYTFGGRQIYEKDSTITAQYGTGIVKIVYIDQDGNKIEDKYKIVGKDYPSEKSGGLGISANDNDFAQTGPEFKGYIFSSKDSFKGNYKDPKDPDVGTVTYKYNKKVTTTKPKYEDNYFKVIFNANGGKFGTDAQKTLWVYMYTGDNPVTFGEARAEIESEYGLPTKKMAKFKEWQNKAKDGSTVADNNVIKVPDWDWTTYPDTGYTPETFYAFWNYNEITAEELTVHESFKDDEADAKKDWSNNFAPKLDTLKGQVKIKDASGKPHALAKDDTFAIVDGDKEYTTDEELKTYLYDKLKEKDDGNKPSRTETITAKVTHANGTSQTVEIPIKVIKNIYEAKTLTEKPFYVPDGYVKVTLNPTTKVKDPQKYFYYVNPKAWVEIPEIKLTDEEKANLGFTNWTADKDEQNEKDKDDKSTGVFDYSKRHKFTKETVISPEFSKDVVEQKDKDKKPEVPENFVKVVVKTTDKATTESTQTFWVNPTKEVTIPVTNPTGKSDQEVDIPKLGKKKVNYVFKDWQKVQMGQADDSLTKVDPAVKIDLAKNQYTDKVTVIEAAYYERFAATPIVKPIKTEELHTPEGKEITEKDLIDKITPPANKEIESIIVVEKPDPSKPGKQEAKVTIKYKDGSTQGTDKDPVVIPVEVHKNIIPEAPGGQRPKEAMENYVKVIFKAGEGGTVSGNLVYYVSPEVEVDMTESAKAIAKKPNTGYTAEGGTWDKELKAKFKDGDVITFNFKSLDDVIPEIKEDGKKNEKPDNYITVTFKTTDKAGSVEKVVYINPNKAVELKNYAPEVKPITGYEFADWDRPIKEKIQYKDNDVITAKFNEQGAVIPKTNPDGSENKQPAGYNKVEFVIDPSTGGKIADKEVTVYYVNPAKEVTVPQPKRQADTGYEFDKWDQDTTTAKKYTADTTTVKGNFKKLDDIIPSKKDDGTPNAKPDGYVTVTFDKGEHGTEIKGQTVYYVNPKADPAVKLGNEKITKPSVTAKTGYKFTGWDTKDDFEIKDNKTVIAQYESIDDVIPKNNPQGGENKIPEGYITVTFEKGANGELEGNTTFFVNPNKPVVLEGKAPTIKPNTGYTSAGWDTTINKAIKYNDGDKITALYNELGDVIPQEKTDGSDKPDGYFTVTFDKGEHGELSGKTVYYVKPNKKVTVPAPTVNASVGYKFTDWDQKLTQTFTADNTTITAQYTELDKIIPQKNTDGSDRPNGYVTVTFKADANGTLSGTTVYYVKPNVDIDLTDTAKAITKNPNTGYTEEGGTWNPAITSKAYTENAEYTFNFVKLDDVIPEIKEDGNKNKKPDGYITVTLIPTDKATDATNKVYFVNPKAKNVTITNKPEGKKETINGIEYTYVFKGWTVTKGTVASWANENIKGKFTQETEITAQYSTNVVQGELVPAPVAKKNVVTPKGDVPEANDLITNIPGSENDPLPKGTEISYKEQPKVDETGKTTAKVEVKYPNGKTVVVEVPITVVDNVVPQTGKDKPLVPESYVKVIVDTTEKAEENTRFVKTFWVKPNVEVTIPGIFAPNGKTEIIDGVTKKNNFVKWQLEGTTGKTYDKEIKDKFTATESKIVATYEQDKNVEPKGKDDQWIPQGSNPSPKDFIENPYNDDDPNNKDNLPPGTKIEFVKGKEPDTKTPGTGKKTTIKITYPNGETKEVPVKFNVTGDVVEQKDKDKKPEVPDDYVKVVVKTTDKATEEFERTFWVKPNKEVTIPVDKPEGKSEDNKKYVFDSWTWENGNTKDEIKGTFIQDTEIVAKYKTTTKPKEIEQIPEVVSEIPIVSLNQSDIDKDWFKIKNKNETDSKIKNVEIIEKPATDSLGIQSGKAKVTFENGSSRIITIKLKVVDDVIETKDDKRTKDVPDNYKLVILDSTSDALEQTKRYFWINPDKNITLKAFKPQGKDGKVFDKWDRSLSINWNKEGITEEVLTIKAIYKDDNTPGGTTPGDKPGDKPGDNPGGTTPGDKPGDEPGDNPGGTTPGDKPGDKPGTVPENPGAIPGTKPGVVEKHGNRYVERVAGKNRVHTAISTSNRFFKKSKYVIIADSGNYPDALTATVLAHVLDCPILLNNTRYLEDDVAREIVRLGASEVIIVGGHKSISENVKSQLAKYDANKVQRIWGRDRYVTSSELAYEIERLTGKVNKAIIASGENFPDALATAPLGSKEIAPILLVRRNQIDKKVDKALKDLNIKRVYVAGGQHSVSKKLGEQLPQVIRRFNGQDRYETAILVASYTYPESKEVFVASGETFPDALVIGPVCARRKAPILLSKSTPVKVTDDYIEKSKIEYLYIIGGTNTIHVDTAHKYAIED